MKRCNRRPPAWLAGLFICLPVLLSGCDRGTGSLFALPGAAPTPFIPPTEAAPLLEPTAPPAVPQAEAPRPTSPPACNDQLLYLSDLTIPDGSSVAAGQALDKRWQVENNGTCNWDRGYRLKLIAGPEMGAAAEQALYPARSATPAVIRILFTAPAEAGVYRSAWQAYNPQGQPFGDPIFIEIAVEAPPASQP
jgi:hypothetical protein